MLVRVEAGSHDAPPEWPGLAHFLEHLLFLGGEQYGGAERFMPFVQRCGGQLNASTGARQTQFFFEVPVEGFEGAAERLMDMLVRPCLRPDDQLREREVLEAEYLARASDARQLGQSALLALLAPGHPCAGFHAGNRSTLMVESGEFQQALRGFHQRFYRAGRVCLVMVGPQSTDQLLVLGSRWAARLAPSRGIERQPAPAFPVLPAGGWQLRLTAGRPRLWLGLRLESAAPGFDEAVDLLIQQLASGLPEGLLDHLTRKGWVDDLHVHPLYRYGGQAILGLELSPGRHGQPAAIRETVAGWLRLLAGQLPQVRAQARCAGRSALQAAQHWIRRFDSDALQPGPGAETLKALLEGFDAGQLIALRAAPDAQGDPATVCGFPARLAPWTMEPGEQALPIDRLPSNSLQEIASPLPLAELPAALVTRPWHETEAVLYLRWSVPGNGEAWRRALRPIAAAAEELSLALEARSTGSGFALRCAGAEHLLPRLLQQVALSLSATGASGEALVCDDMPVRQLMRALPEFFVAPCAGSLRWDGLLVGGDDAWHRASLGGALRGLPGAPSVFEPIRRLPAGRQFHAMTGSGTDAALLLFCPVPALEPLGEAALRCLGQSLQAGFYQRMRGELQLGYGVFSGFQQIGGQAGLVFALQSPHQQPEQLLAHVEHWLRLELGGRRFDDAQEGSALLSQLSTEGLRGHAERLWQAHLAGQGVDHPAQVDTALAALPAGTMQRYFERLLAAEGGWLILASQGMPTD